MLFKILDYSSYVVAFIFCVYFHKTNGFAKKQNASLSPSTHFYSILLKSKTKILE